MKYRILDKLLFLVFVIVAFSACDLNNTGDDPKTEDIYLASYEKHKTYTVDEMKSVLNFFAISYPELQTIVDNLTNDIDVYKITYHTTFKDEKVIASGLVSVPSGEGVYPLLSYQNGTNTRHIDAPTASPDDQLYMLLEFIASTGFIVAAPDYLGFGASKNMFHPYLEKESTVNSLIDMLRASEEFVMNHLSVESNNDLYIVGYSQGGWSTMQLQKEIELHHSSEFKLKASSCGAGPYDIRYINDNILSQNTYPMPYYVGYIINSFINSGHITNPASDIFKSPYDNRIMTMFDGTSTGAELNKQLTTVVADLVTEEYRSTYQTNPKFASVIAAQENNSVSAWKTKIPTLLTHGTDDTYVPFGVSEKLYNDFMALGVNESTVTFIPLEGADHSGGIVPSGVASFNWFIELKNAN